MINEEVFIIGFLRVLGSGIVGMLIMIPTAYICLVSLDTFALITSGLIRNIWMAAGIFGGSIVLVFSIFLGVGIICLFPIHWVLINRPGDVLLLLALALPWIITCSLSSALFAHSPRGGIHTSLGIGIGFFVLMLIPYLLLSFVLGQTGLGGSSIIDSIIIGLTGLPWVLSVLTATMEGAGVGAFFGALVGSFKYKPEGQNVKKSKKSKKELDKKVEPIFTSTTQKCNICKTQILPGDFFCTKCGEKF